VWTRSRWRACSPSALVRGGTGLLLAATASGSSRSTSRRRRAIPFASRGEVSLGRPRPRDPSPGAARLPDARLRAGPTSIFAAAPAPPPGRASEVADRATARRSAIGATGASRDAAAPSGGARREWQEELSRRSGGGRDHLMSDVPLGVFLSGGLTPARSSRSCTSSGVHPIRTFTIGSRSRATAGHWRGSRDPLRHRAPRADRRRIPRPPPELVHHFGERLARLDARDRATLSDAPRTLGSRAAAA